jgi:hypothetical protein
MAEKEDQGSFRGRLRLIAWWVAAGSGGDGRKLSSDICAKLGLDWTRELRPGLAFTFLQRRFYCSTCINYVHLVCMQRRILSLSSIARLVLSYTISRPMVLMEITVSGPMTLSWDSGDTPHDPLGFGRHSWTCSRA